MERGLEGHGRGHRWDIERDIGRVTGLGIGRDIRGLWGIGEDIDGA